jgi:phage portal protein BeeE
MEWTAGLRWSLEGIARGYGVPLPLLENFSRATLSNVRESRRMFWEKTIVPELIFLQDTINDSLLPKLGVDAHDTRVEFDLSVVEALGETEPERTKRQVALVAAGIISVEEARAERGM